MLYDVNRTDRIALLSKPMVCCWFMSSSVVELQALAALLGVSQTALCTAFTTRTKTVRGQVGEMLPALPTALTYQAI